MCRCCTCLKDCFAVVGLCFSVPPGCQGVVMNVKTYSDHYGEIRVFCLSFEYFHAVSIHDNYPTTYLPYIIPFFSHHHIIYCYRVAAAVGEQTLH